MQVVITPAEWLSIGDSFESVFLGVYESVSPGTHGGSADLCISFTRLCCGPCPSPSGHPPSVGDTVPRPWGWSGNDGQFPWPHVSSSTAPQPTAPQPTVPQPTGQLVR